MKLPIVMSKPNNFSTQYRIYYEDTDAGGVVYYANYLKFFERARTDFLRSLGLSQFELSQKEKLAFVVRKCEIEYFLPAKLDDLIETSVIVESAKGAIMLMSQEIKKDGLILTQLKVEIVCITSRGFKPRKIPTHLLQLINGQPRA